MATKADKKNAKKAKLTSSQFYFDARHPYANARKKLPCLKRLPKLTNDMVCILKEMQTVTIIWLAGTMKSIRFRCPILLLVFADIHIVQIWQSPA